MTTKNPPMIGRAQRLQMTKLGALLLLAAPMAAFSSGCGNVGPGSDAEGNLGQTQQALTTCVTLDATADARISKAAKNQNFGNNPVLQVAEKDETLIRFDLSGIPASAAINSATLKLYSQGQHNNDDDDDCDDDEHRIRIHRAKNAWSEGSVTYKNFDQQYDGATAGILAPSQNSALQSANVKNLVTQWVSGAKPNHGFLLEKSDDDKTVFSSSESNNAALRPALEVCYTTPDANHCEPNPCANGTCTNTPSSYTCACDAGWTGTNCDTNINECAGNPCQNGGACTDGLNSYTCACLPGFSGANCETNIDECAGAPCQNGGVCTDGVNSYSCSCEPGYGGTNCEIDIDECAGAPCQNAGTCTDGVNGYTCACPAGFTGTNCEIDIDECASNPCVNGACIDQINSYVCSCDPGFDGVNCENNIDECAGAPCLNGGSCTDGLFSYTCACAPGYTGTNCEINIDDCAVNPCQNDGICVDGVNKYTCSCPIGWIGASCETVAVFAPPVNAIPVAGPTTARIADFNNDGHLDMFNIVLGGFGLLLGNGDGTFQAPSVLVSAQDFVNGANSMIGDFNGDANSDFVVATAKYVGATPDSVPLSRYIVGLGNGDGTFQYTDVVLPRLRAIMISGDWNGDGNLDMMGVRDGTSPALSLNLGNGDGTFQQDESFGYPIPLVATPFIKAADFNGDGHLDFYVSVSGGLLLFLGNGDGTFLSPLSLSLPGENISNANIGDVNGDGTQDLLASTFTPSGRFIRPLLNNGDATFQIGPATPFNLHTSLVMGDWNGDGHLDIAGTQTPLGSVGVRLGNGDGTFQALGSYGGFAASNVIGPVSILAGDFDDNSSPDLLVGTGNGTFKFMRNLTVSATDPCAQNPCQNGGTCNNDGNGYTCACTPLWTGTNCDVSLGYDCVSNNPCTEENINNGNFYFPASISQEVFIQCSMFGQCDTYLCPLGTVWHQELLTCDAP